MKTVIPVIDATKVAHVLKVAGDIHLVLTAVDHVQHVPEAREATGLSRQNIAIEPEIITRLQVTAIGELPSFDPLDGVRQYRHLVVPNLRVRGTA